MKTIQQFWRYRILNETCKISFLASMTLAANNTESGTNNNMNMQQALSKKAFLGSNTSIGRNSNREGNIPVRAVSPRVRWVEDKPNDHYGSQNMSASQQNVRSFFVIYSAIIFYL